MTRGYQKEWDIEVKVENYLFSVNSLFLTEGSKTAENVVDSILKEKANCTFEKALSS